MKKIIIDSKKFQKIQKEKEVSVKKLGFYRIGSEIELEEQGTGKILRATIEEIDYLEGIEAYIIFLQLGKRRKKFWN